MAKTIDATSKEVTASDGFWGVECNDNALFMDNQGNIWFGTVIGLTRYNQSEKRINNSAPLTHIVSMKINNKEAKYIATNDSVIPWSCLPYI